MATGLCDHKEPAFMTEPETAPLVTGASFIFDNMFKLMFNTFIDKQKNFLIKN
jgi:hypothetical protein